jgi:RNA-binding protein 25
MPILPPHPWQVNGALLDAKIHPWVNKKIVEYIGEEEPSLVEFICEQVWHQTMVQHRGP